MVSEKVAAHSVSLMDVVGSASDGLKVDFWSMAELLWAGERGVRVSIARTQASGTPSSMPLVTGND